MFCARCKSARKDICSKARASPNWNSRSTPLRAAKRISARRRPNSSSVKSCGASPPSGRRWSDYRRANNKCSFIAQGATTKEIAQKLGLSVKTVKTHRTELMEQLDIHDIAGLVRFAVRVGLIDADR